MDYRDMMHHDNMVGMRVAADRAAKENRVKGGALMNFLAYALVMSGLVYVLFNVMTGLAALAT